MIHVINNNKPKSNLEMLSYWTVSTEVLLTAEDLTWYSRKSRGVMNPINYGPVQYTSCQRECEPITTIQQEAEGQAAKWNSAIAGQCHKQGLQ